MCRQMWKFHICSCDDYVWLVFSPQAFQWMKSKAMKYIIQCVSQYSNKESIMIWGPANMTGQCCSYSWEGFLLKYDLWRVPYMNLAFSSDWSFVFTWITLILRPGFCNSCLSFPVYIEYLSTAGYMRKTMNNFHWHTNDTSLNYIITYL